MPNAKRFIDACYQHPERPLLVHQGGEWFRWDGACWPTLEQQGLRAQLYDHFEHAVYVDSKGIKKPFAPSRRKIDDLVDVLRAVTMVPVSTQVPAWIHPRPKHGLTPADHMIPCKNGLVYWPSRTLTSPTPNHFTHHAVQFDFDPKAPEPKRWLKFLRELWGNDTDSVETLQEIFGYALSGDSRQQKIFLIVGPKRSGKGTVARVLTAMLGAHNVAGPTLAGLGTNFGLSPLVGKPVAIISDARLRSADTSIVTERLLSISGQDILTVDRKYREPWTGTLPSRLLILSNELPRLNDSSGALASRFIVLTMTQSFYGRENPDLTTELCAELPGIFNWSLDGIERLRLRGRFKQPKTGTDAIRQLEDLGSPVGAFVRDECRIGAEFEVGCDPLYQSWKSWCEDQGRHASNKQVFGRDLRAAYPGIGITQRRDGAGSRSRIYTGLGLTRSDTRSGAMYSAQPTGGPNSGRDRVPSRANCRACDGEGCRWCGS